MKYIPNTMKFGAKIRSSLLIINTIFEIVDLDRKLNTWADLVSKLQCNVQSFYKIWHSEQIKHANCENINRN